MYLYIALPYGGLDTNDTLQVTGRAVSGPPNSPNTLKLHSSITKQDNFFFSDMANFERAHRIIKQYVGSNQPRAHCMGTSIVGNLPTFDIGTMRKYSVVSYNSPHNFSALSTS